MVEDATFEDGAERPLRLKAQSAEDLQVVASLVQDAVLTVSEIKWQRQKRKFALLLNRFRWEDKHAAERRGRDFERVRSVLAFDDVKSVQSQGIDPTDKDVVLSLLTIGYSAGDDAAGRIELTFAGDGALALDVESIEVTLQDVTQPYVAPSGRAPDHPE